MAALTNPTSSSKSKTKLSPPAAKPQKTTPSPVVAPPPPPPPPAASPMSNVVNTLAGLGSGAIGGAIAGQANANMAPLPGAILGAIGGAQAGGTVSAPGQRPAQQQGGQAVNLSGFGYGPAYAGLSAADAGLMTGTPSARASEMWTPSGAGGMVLNPDGSPAVQAPVMASAPKTTMQSGNSTIGQLLPPVPTSTGGGGGGNGGGEEEGGGGGGGGGGGEAPAPGQPGAPALPVLPPVTDPTPSVDLLTNLIAAKKEQIVPMPMNLQTFLAGNPALYAKFVSLLNLLGFKNMGVLGGVGQETQFGAPESWLVPGTLNLSAEALAYLGQLLPLEQYFFQQILSQWLQYQAPAAAPLAPTATPLPAPFPTTPTAVTAPRPPAPPTGPGF